MQGFNLYVFIIMITIYNRGHYHNKINNENIDSSFYHKENNTLEYLLV
jgi:hypothetical protein